MTSEQDKALHKTMEQEAEALAALLATPGRCVMVHVIIAYDDQDDTVDHIHATAGYTTRRHGMQFMRAIECKLNWIKGLVFGQG